MVSRFVPTVFADYISPHQSDLRFSSSTFSNGDSGGPLFIRGKGPDEDFLVGTVAWGIGCADERYPGVYSRMSYMYSWIAETVCAESEDPPLYFHCDGLLFANSTNTTNWNTTEPSITPSDVPSLAPSSAPSLGPTDSGKLDFLAWNPPTPLSRCQGDCDKDWDCAGDLVCLQRSAAGEDVPGCTGGGVPSIADFCYDPNDLVP